MKSGAAAFVREPYYSENYCKEIKKIWKKRIRCDKLTLINDEKEIPHDF